MSWDTAPVLGASGEGVRLQGGLTQRPPLRSGSEEGKDDQQGHWRLAVARALGLTKGPQELGRSHLGTPLVSRAHSSWQHPRLSKH